MEIAINSGYLRNIYGSDKKERSLSVHCFVKRADFLGLTARRNF